VLLLLLSLLSSYIFIFYREVLSRGFAQIESEKDVYRYYVIFVFRRSHSSVEREREFKKVHIFGGGRNLV
jgi:hypothetical protein